MQKRCSRCGETKDQTLFSRASNQKDGRARWCKACSAEQKRNSPAQAESARKRANAYFLANREKVRADRKAQYQADPETAKEAMRAYYRANRDRVAAINRAWVIRNIERARSNEQSRRARALGLFVEHVDRIELLNRHRGICGICGDPVDCDNFDVDHVIPTSRGGEHSYANTQPAHKPCNQSKRNKILPQAAISRVTS